ncbi:hypothetical protein Agabi119p4_7014 [Agaricus bisporus var. burnettii]|uniref:Uncharacterized protein n=1 Tax=Agaricus bisporus var. burnettii TaxID=192524 RepID=A0A8H7F0M3_AGABI|nr:hypothetical protein Agabi119p4_7014 [Agaricus bisporus var. burnettii]
MIPSPFYLSFPSAICSCAVVFLFRFSAKEDERRDMVANGCKSVIPQELRILSSFSRRVAEEELRREERLYGPFASFHSSFFCFELSNLLSLRQSQETEPGGTVNKLLLFFLVHVKKRGRKKTEDIGEVTTTGTGARNKDGTLVRQATNRNRNKDGTLVGQATTIQEPESKQGWYIGQDLYWAFFFSSLVSCLFNLLLVRSEKRSWIQVIGRVRRSDTGVTLKLKAQGVRYPQASSLSFKSQNKSMTNSGIEGGVGLVVLQSSPMVPPFFTLLLPYFSFSHYHHFYMSMGRGNLRFKNVCVSYIRGGRPAYIPVVRLWVHVNIKASKTRTALADIGSDNGFGGEIVCTGICKRLQVSYISFWVRRNLGGCDGGD